jgi:C-terminal processing protease CtpA/Prc
MVNWLLTLGVILHGQIFFDERPGRIGILYNGASHTIVRVYANSPAHFAGLKKYDKVLKVEDPTSIKEKPDIKGPTGTYVTLTIQRGSNVFVVKLPRVVYESVDVRKEVKD